MINKICKQCKKTFKSRPDRGIFCSRICRGFSERNKIQIECIICKKKIFIIPSIKSLRFTCSKYCQGRYFRKKYTGKTWNWKGDAVSYRSLHAWVTRWKGQPDTCKHCGKSGLKGRAIHWANKSKKYLRNLDDWIRLCMQCHKIFDKKH